MRRTRLGFLRWRRLVHRNPHTSAVYRTLVGGLGTAVVLLGLVLVPLPGPGWLIVFCGVAIIASEFHFASRLLHWGRLRLEAWSRWVRRSHWSIGALLGLATCACVCGAVWLSLHLTGVPGWTPGWARQLLLLP
ncbi:TIGR02611 family protein [Brevibacterium rongguiense]|uniref:TIGR02611 family protein n=1 Tax=Brevibacterium rongguiense TaxID=2695267 RepID=UPI002E2CF8F9|nr:TIGR02611 family protein [Brevibacterium rongguiense]